ncbi:MAG: HDOD domain-containing protein [Gemmatimonadaceae bacterium]|nr:HDOD domain-containing protein [Gemmatimonadaceae bacterium]
MNGQLATPTRRVDSDADQQSLVDARLARIQEASDFPALSRQIIDTISLIDDDASSLQRLANVVLREYSLTLGVVRTANTVHYRRTGRPIQSATHAMMMLGARTVRHLASSLLLFENYSKRSPVLKELMVMSLITANHAREVSSRLQRGDPEEAHLCGMFRNLGEVLIACHFPDDYARIQERTEGTGQTLTGAAHAVLGFRYEDLAVAVARHWGMPDTVVQGIRARPGAVSSDASAITAFSHDLTLAIYRHDATGEHDAERAVHAAMERHAAHLKVSREQVRDVVEAALDETRELFSSAKVPMEARQLKELADAARMAMGLSATPTGEWEIETVNHHDTPGSPALRRRLRQELESKVDPGSGAELGEVLLLALEAALRGGPFDRVIACVLNADRTRLSARSGLGTGVEALMTRFDFPMTAQGGPVVAMMQQRHATYVPVDRAPTSSETRWVQQVGAAQFGVFPIAVARTMVGCLYGDRADGEPVPDRVALEYVKSLSAVVVKAIEARRRASSVATHTVPHPTRPSPDVSSPDGKSALVLRLLRGESPATVAASASVSVEQLEAWRAAFLEGAMTRLASG